MRGAVSGDRIRGPVGYFAIQSAKLMAAETIIAIDTVTERIALARKAGATHVIDFAEEDIYERILEISGGKGADSVIDCVGWKPLAATASRGSSGAPRRS